MTVPYHSPDLRHVFKRTVAIEMERLAGLREQADDKYQQELDHLRAEGGDEDEGIEFYADEAAVLESIRTLADDLMVVGHYRIVELNTVKIVDWRLGVGSAKAAAAHKFPNLKKLLSSKVGVDISALPGYTAIDELRLINNAIKHDGSVSAELARYGWPLGAPLGHLEAALNRLAPEVPRYLEALADQVLPKPR